MRKFNENDKLLDWKYSDVNGNGFLDSVYLYGQVDDASSVYADNITLVIQNGWTGQNTIRPLKNGAGYNARLFLGDFTKNQIADIMVSIETGGSGGYGIYYIYSFKNNNLTELFNVDEYNKTHTFEVSYEDFYKVQIKSLKQNTFFILDISHKGTDYLSQFYEDNGRLKHPTRGDTLALGALQPIVTNSKRNHYDLVALQRITGATNADTLGYIQNLLTWQQNQFISNGISLVVKGTPMLGGN